MDFVVTTIATVAGFGAGVVFHKYVISEATSIKAHVTAEVSAVKTAAAAEFASLRADLKAAVDKVAQKV